MFNLKSLTAMSLLIGMGCSTPLTPINIGSRLELMVDNLLIDQTMGSAKLTLQRPTEKEVVFTFDQPWEGNSSGYATIFKDGLIYRMYYRGQDWRSFNEQSTLFTCYAESKDGINWERPNLDLVLFKGSKKNNIILSGEISNTFVPFKDTNPNCNPGERYKAIAALSQPSKGLYSFSSSDGIHWQPMSKDPIITKGKFDSQNLAFWCNANNRYLVFHREMRGQDDEIRPGGLQLGLDQMGQARDVMTSSSSDFRYWTKPQWLQYPGSRREQIYLNQIRPYYRAPHILVGFPGRFMAGREIKEGLPITKHPSYKFGSISETLFMTSRDGVNFKRWGEAFVRPGLRKERWIYPNTFPAYGLTVTEHPTQGMPNELSFYINDGGYWTSGGIASRLRRYTLRIDGFVSLQAPLAGGEIVTKPIIFKGKKLIMNFSTSAAGSVKAEIQGITGRPIPGFALSDSAENFGDQIKGVLNWKGNPDLSKLAGQPVRLRFVLSDADLYSFSFGD